MISPSGTKFALSTNNMPRKPRQYYSGAVAHIYFRGNRKKLIFYKASDYKEYLNRLESLSVEENCNVIAYSLMPNHGHIILLQLTQNPISRLMQRLQGGFTQYCNTKYQKVGHLFQGRYKCSLCLKESYLLELIRYVHLNAPRAGIVRVPEEYRWCSHKNYINQTNSFINTKLIASYFENLDNFDAFVKSGLKQDVFFQKINETIEVAFQNGQDHPLPPLQNLLNNVLGTSKNTLSQIKTKEFFETARQHGYNVVSIAKFLNLERSKLYRILRKAIK